jgi:6,7-dimethyl-8-ribityllumazine synthase
MATVNNNLSEYDINSVPNASKMAFGIVVSEWNENITKGLLNGAYSTLLKHGALEDNIIVKFLPGAFELPLGAQTMFEKTNVDAVICLGSVIQGETKHFDFVCEGAALGIKDVSLKYNKPAIFGILTDNTEQQAIDRSGGKHGNKGDEAAVTAIKMVDFQKNI